TNYGNITYRIDHFNHPYDSEVGVEYQVSGSNQWDLLCTCVSPIRGNATNFRFACNPSISVSEVSNIRFRVKLRIWPERRQDGTPTPSIEGPSSGFYTLYPPPPLATTVISDISCSLGSGTATIFVSGVTKQFATYRYILTKGDNV